MNSCTESIKKLLPHIGFCLILIFAYTLRTPNLNRDLYGIHDWKNIRHYQFAQGMIETRNPIIGLCNFTQPETNPARWNATTESPWVDWPLVGAYLLLGQSIETFRLTFIMVNLLTLVLFYFILRPYFGSWLTLLGSLVFAIVPYGAYFSGHSIGENYLYSGQILLVVVLCKLFTVPFKKSNYLLFLLVCFHLGMCKFTTGGLIAGCAFWGVHIALFRIYWKNILAFVKSHPVWTAVIVLFYFIPALLALGVLVHLISGFLVAGIYPFLGVEFRQVMYQRWTTDLGFYLFLSGWLAFVFYIGHAVFHLFRQKKWNATLLEKSAFFLLLLNCIQCALQSRPFIAHEYYSVTFIIPWILITLCFLKRLFDHSGKLLFTSVLCLFLAGFAYSLPSGFRKLQWLYRFETISKEGQNTLKTFFARRKTGDQKYFIMAPQPRWAYAADTYMQLAYEWYVVLELLQKTSSDMDHIRRLGISYIVYPTYSIPDDVLKGLETNPLVDNGPECFNLGLVHRGDNFYIFIITDKINSRRPLIPGGAEKGDPAAGWISYGNAFDEGQPIKTENGMVMESSDMGHGNFLSEPISVRGDAILYSMKGKGVGTSSRVELLRDGGIIYTQCPSSLEKETLYALDIGKLWNQEVAINIVDTYAWNNCRISASNFEEIFYSRPKELAKN